MRRSNQQETSRTFDSLSSQQLLIYAREFGEYHRRGRELQNTLSLKEAQMRELVAASYAAQERDRQSLAFEVHDRIAQNLVAAFHQLQALESMARAKPQMQKAVTRALEVVQGAIQESRNIMNDLHPPLLEQHGIIPLIENDLRRLQQDTSCQVKFHAEYAVRLCPDVEVALYRISQEALMNIRRHAPTARNVIVSLRCRDNTVRLQVMDDGPGFDAEAVAQEHRVGGIEGMRRRAEAFGGSLEVASIPGYGAGITARIPLTGEYCKEAPPK